MVGPSMTDEERDATSRRFRAGFVALVGLSGALVAIQTGGDATQIAVALVAGLLLGAVLSWFLWRLASEFALSGGKRGPPR